MTRDEFLASHGLTKTPKLAAMHLGQVEKWYRAAAYEPTYTEVVTVPRVSNDLVGDVLKAALEYGSQQDIQHAKKLDPVYSIDERLVERAFRYGAWRD